MTAAIAINPGDCGATLAASVLQINTPLLSLKSVAIAPPGVDAAIMTQIDLQVARGERVALVGPSGTGKTTLLRTVNGQIRAHTGQIVFDGVSMASLSATALRQLRSKIGFVAQKHDLVEPLRVHQNVMAGALGRWSNRRALRYLVWPRQEELDECQAALASVGLAHKLHEPTTALSGGEQQRVAIARALVQAPQLLLADEPVASLDPSTANDILGLLTSLAHSRGMALICSLHQPDLAARYFDRIIEVRQGTLMELGAKRPVGGSRGEFASSGHAS
jgi:phosphonate transport system ATP-binding protein